MDARTTAGLAAAVLVAGLLGAGRTLLLTGGDEGPRVQAGQSRSAQVVSSPSPAAPSPRPSPSPSPTRPAVPPVELGEVVVGDVDGDGVNEGAAVVGCSVGNSVVDQVGVGSTEAEVLAACGDRAKRERNEYVDLEDVFVQAGEVPYAALIEGCA